MLKLFKRKKKILLISLYFGESGLNYLQEVLGDDYIVLFGNIPTMEVIHL